MGFALMPPRRDSRRAAHTDLRAGKTKAGDRFVFAGINNMKLSRFLLITSAALLIAGCAEGPAGPGYVDYGPGPNPRSGYYWNGSVYVEGDSPYHHHDDNDYNRSSTNVNDVTVNRTNVNERTVNDTNVNDRTVNDRTVNNKTAAVDRTNGHTTTAAAKTHAHKKPVKPNDAHPQGQPPNQ
jgi:hypothetical protein